MHQTQLYYDVEYGKQNTQQRSWTLRLNKKARVHDFFIFFYETSRTQSNYFLKCWEHFPYKTNNRLYMECYKYTDMHQNNPVKIFLIK